MKLNDKVYNVLKWSTQYLLPASGTLYFALAAIWNLPNAEQVIGTITAVNIFLGVILGLSTAQYRKDGMDGTLRIDTTNPNTDFYHIDVGDLLETISAKKSITLRVDPNADLAPETGE